MDTVFPEPDSPAIPRDSPFLISKDKSSMTSFSLGENLTETEFNSRRFFSKTIGQTQPD